MQGAISKKCEKDFNRNDLVVFSHLRWDFIFLRTQHLITRFAKYRRVFFFEEPHFHPGTVARSYFSKQRENGITVIEPILPEGMDEVQIRAALRCIVDQVMAFEKIHHMTLWYDSPIALPYTYHLQAETVIFDCMEETSSPEWEERLFALSDLVFTGGYSLFEAKKNRHLNMHTFPNSVDHPHFKSARWESDPDDQQHIPHPRIGYSGLIDERVDLQLLEDLADLRPDWNFILVGPVVHVDSSRLPRRPNLHYLGKRNYWDLPKYLSGWDLAMLPLVQNESTKFLSPAPTPEYLAAGCPVVSTDIPEVVESYARENLVHIASTADEFVTIAEIAMEEAQHEPERMLRVDEYLEGNSWDLTFTKMAALEKLAWLQNQSETGLHLTRLSELHT